MSTLSEDSQDTSGWVYPSQPGIPPTNWGVVYPEQPGRPPVVVILAVPVIDPASGSVPVDVTITTEDGLQIIYTTNGTLPSLANGTVASSPLDIHLAAPCTLRAVASNLIDVSDEATATYDPGPVVVITPSSGEVSLNVVLTSAETTDLIYTLDGTAPTLSNGTQVASPVTLNLLEPCMVRAVATDGVDTFSVSSGTYVYTGRVGDPRLIPRLIAWYRSDSVEVTDGLVSTWYDQSGNNIHATPDGTGLPAGGVGPTLVSDVLNGFPALRFNGTTSFLITGYQNFNAPNIFFVVAKQSSKSVVGTFVGSFGDTAMRIGCDTSGFYFIMALPTESHPEQDFILNDSTDHSGAFHNFESMWGLTTSTGWLDGTQVFTDTTPPVTMAVLPLGRDTSSDVYLPGDIVEVIRYYTASFPDLAVSDRKWIEAYLANRYDLPNAVPFAPGPLNIAGLIVWYKADDLALSDGAEITSWIDSSGNGHTATKGTTGPTFKTDILNGHSVARFATGKWMNVSDINATQPCTVIYVIKGPGYVIADHGPGGGFSTSIGNFGAGVGYGLFINANTTIADGIDHTGAFHVFSIVLGSGAGTSGYVDGVLSLNGNAGSSGLDKVAIAAYDQTGTSAALDGDIAEIIIFSRALTDHERNEIELYLKIKYATP